MKRTIRTYFSVVLLLCLAIQFAPLSLMHSHDDHEHVESAQQLFSAHDADEHDGEFVIDADHESSEEDCHICDIQQSLNNQAYTLNKQITVSNFGDQVSAYSGVEVSGDNYLIESTSGRAPPRA